MNINDFIFSNKRNDRIKRHLAFWSFVFIYHILRISLFYPLDKIWASAQFILITALWWGVLCNMILSYVITYYLVPKYFYPKKYFYFGISLLFIFIIIFLLQLFNHGFNKPLSKAIGTEQPLVWLKASVIRLFGNPPLICGLLLSLKTLKTWHLKQKENETLTRENANAELQLLKAQIHPHFLFNTLNNIYSFTLNKSPEASELVGKLSDMMYYMITDCNTDLVALEKEIKMLEDYMGLEKVRYGNRLEMWFDINGDYKNKLIAPLIMIPFVENCFKHGTSMMRGKQWMQLVIHINDNHLDFNLSNSKPSQPNLYKNKNGIGLANVKKRLELLYPGKHQLNVHSSDNAFSVQLQMELQKTEPPSDHIGIINKHYSNINY